MLGVELLGYQFKLCGWVSKTYYEKKIGLGPKPVGSTLRFLGPTFRAVTGYFEKFKIVRT